ncbi:MAG: single-stranded DNA-binding protein [Chloroflexi bacterium]|nr:MAG: single-stranded DNA-binding protein [Chloroflexota bacterium]
MNGDMRGVVSFGGGLRHDISPHYFRCIQDNPLNSFLTRSDGCKMDMFVSIFPAVFRRVPLPQGEFPMYHTIIIAGNVGKDPEMRYTPTGQAVTSFSVATSRQYTAGNGEQVKETIWFRISAWGKTAEACNQYLKKGAKVLIEGRLTPDKNTGGPRIWTKQDGSAGSSFEVTAQTVRFLSSRAESEAGPIPSSGGMEMAELPPEDEIPF